MSSVTRYTRQIPTGLNFVAAQGTIEDEALDFIPTGGNYVGNYPPGYVVDGDQTGLKTAIQAAQAGSNPIIRDMGKTIFAPYSSTVGPTSFTDYGYFRQYQILVPSPISATQGFIGGNGGNTFGVAGPVATAPGSYSYLTFYLPVSIGGVGNAAAGYATNFPSAFPVNGGQM